MLTGHPRLMLIAERPLPRLAVALAGAAMFSLVAVGQAAPTHTPPVAATGQAAHHARHKRSAVKVEAPEPAPPPAPLPPPNALQEPAVPAVVTLGKDELAIRANNASLTQILQQISSQTGMKLDGAGGDERVFGTYGPGAPREVLTALLDGAGYNLVMVGDLPNGAPRELLLSRRAAGSAAPPANPQPQANDNNEEDNANEFEEAPAPPSIAPAEPPQNPGAAAPPQGRTPQQIFMEQRQQQLQQQNSSPQQ